MSGSGISWAICKSAPRSRQKTTPAPHHSVFTGRMPFLLPHQQRQSIGEMSTIQILQNTQQGFCDTKVLESCTWKLQLPTLWMPTSYWMSFHGWRLESLWDIGVKWFLEIGKTIQHKVHFSIKCINIRTFLVQWSWVTMINKKNWTLQHKMRWFLILHFAAVNTTRTGPRKICWIDVTVSCTKSDTIYACIFVSTMPLTKKSIIFLDT